MHRSIDRHMYMYGLKRKEEEERQIAYCGLCFALQLFSVYASASHPVFSAVFFHIHNQSTVLVFTLHQWHPLLPLEYGCNHCFACFPHLY